MESNRSLSPLPTPSPKLSQQYFSDRSSTFSVLSDKALTTSPRNTESKSTISVRATTSYEIEQVYGKKNNKIALWIVEHKKQLLTLCMVLAGILLVVFSSGIALLGYSIVAGSIIIYRQIVDLKKNWGNMTNGERAGSIILILVSCACLLFGVALTGLHFISQVNWSTSMLEQIINRMGIEGWTVKGITIKKSFLKDLARIMLVVGHSVLSTAAYYAQSKIHARSVKREIEKNTIHHISIVSSSSFSCRNDSVSAISNCSGRSRRIKSDFMFHPILPHTVSNLKTDGTY